METPPPASGRVVPRRRRQRGSHGADFRSCAQEPHDRGRQRKGFHINGIDGACHAAERASSQWRSHPFQPAGGTTGGRHSLAPGSHHQPLSQASGCGPTPNGRHTLAVGSHHWPGSHAKGCGPTPSGRQTLPEGSHHSPAAQSALLTAGVTTVTAAIDANANITMTTKMANERPHWSSPRGLSIYRTQRWAWRSIALLRIRPGAEPCCR